MKSRFVSAVVLGILAAIAQARPLVGAIRWDAWTGAGNSVGKIVNTTLSPSVFHVRLPFFAKVNGVNSVAVNGNSQAIMDQEIQYAHSAGLDYWAFDYYPSNTGLAYARELYLKSALRRLIKFCLILNVNPNPDFATLTKTYFKNPSYQKLLSGRPLLYLFGIGNYSAADIANLRQLSIKNKAGNPYIVVLGQPVDALAIGADAVSAYAAFGSNGEPFRQLMADEQAGWEGAKASGMQVIPWVSTGWDPRPRIVHVTPWITYPTNGWVEKATPNEIATHLNQSFEWTAANPAVCQANAVLMYAWNENDEGGWLCPTLYEGTQRIDAVRAVVNGNARSPNLVSGLPKSSYSASSAWDSSQAAANAFDGIYSTNWQATSGSAFSNQWIQADLGRNQSISRVVLSEYGGRTQSFEIDVWTGKAWQAAFTGTAIGSGPTAYDFPVVTGSKVRLRYLAGTATPILFEFEVYSCGGLGPLGDLATGQSYSASSFWDATMRPANAFDGNWGTCWQAGQGSNISDQWLECDFDSKKLINEVVIGEYGQRTSGFVLQYWDGNAWRVAATVNQDGSTYGLPYLGSKIGSAWGPSTFDFPAVETTRFRIQFTSGEYTPIIFDMQLRFRTSGLLRQTP